MVDDWLSDTGTVRPNFTRTGLRFFRRKLLRLPYIRMIFPPPVTRKREAAPLCVLIFGTSSSLLPRRPSRYRRFALRFNRFRRFSRVSGFGRLSGGFLGRRG